jgi:hypothetical protein
MGRHDTLVRYVRQLERPPVGGYQPNLLPVMPVAVHGPDRMDHMARTEPTTTRHLRVARRAAAEHAAASRSRRIAWKTFSAHFGPILDSDSTYISTEPTIGAVVLRWFTRVPSAGRVRFPARRMSAWVGARPRTSSRGSQAGSPIPAYCHS